MEDKVVMRITPTTKIAAACSTENSRFALAAVLAVPGRLPGAGTKADRAGNYRPTDGWLVATNGRILAVAAAAIELDAYPVNDKAMPLVPAGAFPPNVREIVVNGQVEAKRGSIHKSKTELHRLVEASFPPVDEVIKACPTKETVWFAVDATLMIDLARALSANAKVMIGFNAANKPLIVMDSDDAGPSQSFGLLMPLNPGVADPSKLFCQRRERFLADLARGGALRDGKEPPAEEPLPELPEPKAYADELEDDFRDESRDPQPPGPRPVRGPGAAAQKRRGIDQGLLDRDRRLVEDVMKQMAALGPSEVAVAAAALSRVRAGQEGKPLTDVDRSALEAIRRRAAPASAE